MDREAGVARKEHMNQKALYQITYGLYLLTAHADERDNGCVINTAIQVANNPTRVSVAVIKNNLTHDMIAKTGVFNVSAISKDATFALFQRFGMQSGRDADKFEGFDGAKRGENGLLYLTDGACMMLSCRVTEQHDMGSHTLFVGELTAAEVLSDTEPCTYAYYQSDIKPRKKAKKGWVCTVCGYVYEGDELPKDYVCPICKHGPEAFQRMDGEEKSAQEKPAAGGKKWVCTVCGYIYEGETPPEQCPICKVAADKFTLQSPTT